MNYSDSLSSSLQSAMLLKCPRCGKGSLYQRHLLLQPTCSSCQYSIASADTGDGPVYVVLCIIGALITSLAVVVELAFEPPFWVHAVVWPLVVLVGSYLLLKWVKAMFIALEYYYSVSH